MPEVNYEITAYSRVPNQSAAPTLTELGRIIPLGGESSGASGGLSWSTELCSDGSITVATRPENIPATLQTRMTALRDNPVELWLWRDGVLRQRGPLIAWQVEGNSIVFTARGMLYYLRYMTLTVDKAYNQDQALIAKDLVDHHQAKDYGNYGIDTSGITSHGVTRERTYKRTELINIYKEVHALGEANNGFDIEVDPTDGDLVLTNPQKGTDRSASVFLDSRGLTNPNFAYSLAAGEFGTAAVGSGTTPDNAPVFHEEISTTERNAFGLAYVTANIFGVHTSTEIDSYVTQAAALARNPYFVPSREFFQVQGAGVDDFDVGDTVTFVYDPGFGEVTISQDVKNRVVSMSPEGNEKMTVEFV